MDTKLQITSGMRFFCSRIPWNKWFYQYSVLENNIVALVCFSTSGQSLYVALGVSKACSQDDIKKAYRKVGDLGPNNLGEQQLGVESLLGVLH